MEIVQVKQLTPGDRFALRDWMDEPQNRIAYRIPELSQNPTEAKKERRRMTIDVICEIGGGKKIRKSEWVYKLNRG